MERDSFREAYITELEQRVQLLERELRRSFFVQTTGGSGTGSEQWDLTSQRFSTEILYHAKGFGSPLCLPVRDDAVNGWKTPAIKFLDASQEGIESQCSGIIAQRADSGVVLLRHSKDKPLCIEQGGYWLRLYPGGSK